MPRRIMDYPSYFGGWHSVISGGHLLSFMGFIFFVVMIVDSLYEGISFKKKTYGVSRINTRFSFYLYESAKIQNIKLNNSGLLNNNKITSSNIKYVF